MKTSLLNFFLLLLLFYGCQKEETNILDIRDYYVGDFYFDIQGNYSIPLFYGTGLEPYEYQKKGSVNKYKDNGFCINFRKNLENTTVPDTIVAYAIYPIIDTINSTILFDQTSDKLLFTETYNSDTFSYKCTGQFFSPDTIRFQLSYNHIKTKGKEKIIGYRIK